MTPRAPGAEGGRTTYADVIRAAIPDASSDDCEWILWERTPYPMGGSARELFKAASRVRRAEASGIRLCEMCDGKADGDCLCAACRRRMGLATPPAGPAARAGTAETPPP